MSVTYPKSGLQDGVAFQQNGKAGTYPVQSWNDEIGTFQFASGLEEGYKVPAGSAVVLGNGEDGVRLPVSGDAIASGQVVGAKSAQGTVTFSVNPIADENLKIGATTYKFVEALADANDVLLGATLTETLNHLVEAINGGIGAGVVFGAGTTANASAHAVLSENNELLLVALVAGEAGNEIALTSTTDAVLSGATLAGGADAGEAEEANAKFCGVVVFSYYTTTQAGSAYSKSHLDVNLPVKQKGYVTALFSSLQGAIFGAPVALDLASAGKFKVAGEGDIVVGEINKVFEAYGTAEIKIKEFI